MESGSPETASHTSTSPRQWLEWCRREKGWVLDIFGRWSHRAADVEHSMKAREDSGDSGSAVGAPGKGVSTF